MALADSVMINRVAGAAVMPLLTAPAAVTAAAACTTAASLVACVTAAAAAGGRPAGPGLPAAAAG